MWANCCALLVNVPLVPPSNTLSLQPFFSITLMPPLHVVFQAHSQLCAKGNEK